MRRAAAPLASVMVLLLARALVTRAAATPASVTPSYVQRGDVVVAHQHTHQLRLEQFYAALRTQVRAAAPELMAQLGAAPPAAIVHGYQTLPRLTPNPPPAPPPHAKSAWYSWPWTDELIERDTKTLDALTAELDGVAHLPATQRRGAYAALIGAYTRLAESGRTIDAHVQYNRLWQAAIAADRPGYDRQTALHDAVLERQALGDARAAADEAAFRAALAGVHGIDATLPRSALEPELRARARALDDRIHDATAALRVPPFVRVTRPSTHQWIVEVPVITDIARRAFVRAFRDEVERVWHVRDGADEFRVRLRLRAVSAAQLYRDCRGTCRVPRAGDAIDVAAHCQRFPAGAVLTSGALRSHVTAGRCMAVGAETITPHVLAHEFGHVLGFQDVYFRGYRDLGADGFQVMEVLADAGDIMGAPGTGPVLRHHFEALLRNAKHSVGCGEAPSRSPPFTEVFTVEEGRGGATPANLRSSRARFTSTSSAAGRRATGAVRGGGTSSRESEEGPPQTPGFPPRAPPSAARAGPRVAAAHGGRVVAEGAGGRRGCARSSIRVAGRAARGDCGTAPVPCWTCMPMGPAMRSRRVDLNRFENQIDRRNRSPGPSLPLMGQSREGFPHRRDAAAGDTRWRTAGTIAPFTVRPSRGTGRHSKPRTHGPA